MVECKVLRDSDRKSLAGTIERAVEQTLGYMEKCSAQEGHPSNLIGAPRTGQAIRSRRATGAPGAVLNLLI